MAVEWDKVWKTAEDHPYVVGGGVLALVLIFWYAYSYYGNAASTTSAAATGSGVYAYTADPNLAADQAAVSASQNAANAAVSENATNAQTALAIDQSNNQAQTAAATMYYSGATQAATSSNATSVQLAGIQAGSYGDYLSAATSATLSNNATTEQTNNSIVAGLLAAQTGSTAQAGNVGLAWQDLASIDNFLGLGGTGALAFPGGVTAFVGGGAAGPGVSGGGASVATPIDTYAAGGTYNPATGIRTYGPANAPTAPSKYVGTGLTEAGAMYL